jgi:hypothetical protein
MVIMWLRGYHSGKRRAIESTTDERSPNAYGGELGRRYAESPGALLISVLARYSRGPQARKTASATATKAAAPARSGGRPRNTAAKPAAGKHS